jgi:putative DNA primase/helicase
MTANTGSDLPQENKAFLVEPVLPKREDYSSDGDFQLSLGFYKQKLEKYYARKEFLKELDEGHKSKLLYEKRLEAKITNEVYQAFKDLTYEMCCEPDSDDRNTIFKPAKAAELIQTKERFLTDIETGILYYYDGKAWIKDADNYLKFAVARILKEENKVSHYNNIAHHLESVTLEKLQFSKKLACENGLLDVETLEFTEYNQNTKYEMPFYSIPVRYDLATKCPNWEQFVNQVVTPDDVATLQEWSGYCLLPDYRFHKIMWIVGSGRNGKGVWQRTIEGILGNSNVSNVGLEEFDGAHRFSMHQLYGKLVNFCSEPKTNRELQTNLLKYATGQDTIEAELKCKQKRLSFKNCAKITVLANRFPKVNDQTTAFKERRLFLKFPNEFTGSNQIQNLEQNWLNNSEEKSGILNWMLQGLKRLLEQSHFTTSRTQDETELEFLRASDSVSAFINETATFDRHLITTRAEAKTAYEAYCDFYGLEFENEKKFSAKLKDTPKIKDSHTRINGKLERAWIGVRFKVLSEESNQETVYEAQQTLETVTGVTDVTGKTNSLQFSEASINNKEFKTPVTSVTSVTNSEVSGYSGALTCVFCNKQILDDNWARDDFTWDKPAHNHCYHEKKEQLANQDGRAN